MRGYKSRGGGFIEFLANNDKFIAVSNSINLREKKYLLWFFVISRDNNLSTKYYFISIWLIGYIYFLV